MNKIKTFFTVKDLENLSGIKAHTIRIWEKRYGIFSPDRDQNNIRFYNSQDLLKILNISFLNNFGYKISKIANFSNVEMDELVKKIYSEKTSVSLAINSFKYSMFNFDTKGFHSTYDTLLKEKKVEEIFYEVFVPLLDEIGLLWQTSTLKPIHEHFISSLIRQKLLSEIEILQKKNSCSKNRIFVLYLPVNEIHELGLIFVNYLFLSRGYATIYLGESVPLDNLESMKDYYNDIVFVSYFTIEPESEEVENYLEEFRSKILNQSKHELWVLGNQLKNVKKKFDGIKVLEGIQNLILEL